MERVNLLLYRREGERKWSKCKIQTGVEAEWTFYPQCQGFEIYDLQMTDTYCSVQGRKRPARCHLNGWNPRKHNVHWPKHSECQDRHSDKEPRPVRPHSCQPYRPAHHSESHQRNHQTHTSNWGKTKHRHLILAFCIKKKTPKRNKNKNCTCQNEKSVYWYA